MCPIPSGGDWRQQFCYLLSPSVFDNLVSSPCVKRLDRLPGNESRREFIPRVPGDCRLLGDYTPKCGESQVPVFGLGPSAAICLRRGFLLMGRQRRPRPRRLAVKLRQIRTSLGLTQEQMFEQLGDTGTSLHAGHIGEFETDRREPNLLVILAYARVMSTTGGGEFLEALLDDRMDLPDKFPADPNDKGGRRRLVSKTTSRRGGKHAVKSHNSVRKSRT
jgi:transcriptional regulator with XRE-family HTH domain